MLFFSANLYIISSIVHDDLNFSSITWNMWVWLKKLQELRARHAFQVNLRKIKIPRVNSETNLNLGYEQESGINDWQIIMKREIYLSSRWYRYIRIGKTLKIMENTNIRKTIALLSHKSINRIFIKFWFRKASCNCCGCNWKGQK